MVEEVEKRKGFFGRRRAEDRRADVSIVRPRLVFITCVVLLLVIGLVMVYSASSVEAYANFGDPAHFLVRQAGMLAAGIVIAALITRLPFGFWNSHTLRIIWLVAMVALFAVQVLGYIGLGAKRWIDVGPFSFQPSEFAKIAMMLLAASYVVAYREGRFASFWRFGFRMLVVVGAPSVLIAFQPDLGTVVVALVGIVSVLWFGEISRKVVFAILAIVAVGAVIMVLTAGFRSDRLASWMDPFADPLGDGMQAVNSFYAFSEGGLFGVGLGNSTQKYLYLTYAYNDFIFAIIGEEFGLVGALAVIAIFVGLLVSAYRMGRLADSLFGKIICDSFATVIVFQAFLNMSCAIGLLPITGKPLPFISYGGSSMIATMIMVGIILSVSFKNTSDAAQKRRASIHSVYDRPRRITRR